LNATQNELKSLLTRAAACRLQSIPLIENLSVRSSDCHVRAANAASGTLPHVVSLRLAQAPCTLGFQ